MSTPWRLGRMARSTPAACSPQRAGSQPTTSPAGTGDFVVASPGQRDGRIRRVNALAVGPDGSLYAGGYFTTAGGVAANYIARWDGDFVVASPGQRQRDELVSRRPGVWAGWLALRRWLLHHSRRGRSQLHRPLGWDFPVASPGQRDERWRSMPWRLARMARSTPGATSPQPAGSQPTASPAGTGDSTWHPLGSGMEATRVRALAFGPDGSLYAGGWFTTAGGVAASRIARWDVATSSWHPLGSGMRRIARCLRPGVWAGWLALRRGLLHHGRRGRSQLHRPLGRRLRRGILWAVE